MDWTARLFGLLLFFVFFFCFKGCISANVSHPSSGPVTSPEGKDGDRSNTVCHEPYYPVGDYCLFIDNIIRGSWNEMRDVCLDIRGNLANLKDANTLYEISNYIKSNAMDDVSYWVGATDEGEEGKWLWTSDNAPVKGGAPLWGQLHVQQPDGGEDQNCAALFVKDFFYMHDDVCNDMAYGVICQPASEGLISIDDDDQNFNKFNIIFSNECPSPYEMIGGACLRVFPEQNCTWTEAKELCDRPNIHMVKIDDANFLGAVSDYLIEKEINTILWIGGTDEASEGDWVWHDGTPGKIGTNYWTVKSEEVQEPNGDIKQNCLSIWNANSYLFSDFACHIKFGTICQYEMR